MARKPGPAIDWGVWSTTIAAVLGLGGGALLNAWTVAERIATKPYVDDRFTESKRYADDRSAQVLKDAFEHSDANKQMTLLRMEEFKTEIKSSLTEVSTKTDLILHSIQESTWPQKKHKD